MIAIKFDDIYRGIEGVVTKDWETGKTSDRSTFKLKNMPISETIQKATGSDIEAQFWMSKDKNNLNFEFASKEEFKKLRTGIASSFREYIFSRDYPIWLRRSKGSTVSNVSLVGKNDVAVISVVNDYYNFINKVIDEWALETFAGLLTHQAIEYVDSRKIIELRSEAAIKHAVRRMVKTAKDTVSGANGRQVLQTVKEKENRFETDQDFSQYVTDLLNTQVGLCAITGLKLQLDGQADDQELLVSLDRIDSDGHYEPGNLQVICRFVNRWKSDGDDANFRRLMSLVRNSATNVDAQTR